MCEYSATNILGIVALAGLAFMIAACCVAIGIAALSDAIKYARRRK